MPRFFPPHEPYKDYIYKEKFNMDDSNIPLIVYIQCKEFVSCSEQPEGYVNFTDVELSIGEYICLDRYMNKIDSSLLEKYSVTMLKEDFFYVDLPVWEYKF